MSDPGALPARTTVLIVGGGPVGLSMALLLGRFGIDCVLVERHSSTTRHPKSRGCNPRTMELFRQWGIEERIRARTVPRSASGIIAESVAGREYARAFPEPDTGQTPALMSRATQDVVEEELLRELSDAKQAKVRHQVEFVSYQQADGGVRVALRDTAEGRPCELRARYLIAADGANSTIRLQAGVEMEGPETLGVFSNDYWHADLSSVPKINETTAFHIAPRDPAGSTSLLFTPDASGRLLSWTQIGITSDERPVPWTDDQTREIIRRQVGLPRLEVELRGRSIWRLSKQVATRFRAGPVFMVGDAAHRFPPTGGFGMNTGIQDAHNLAWKLALVARGLAGDALLDSYEAERRPVAQSNAEWSAGNAPRTFTHIAQAARSGNADRLAFWVKDYENHTHQIGRALGFSYDEGALISDGTAPGPFSSRVYTPSDRPGSRFPHVWLDLSRRHSTLDWFDTSFVLVAGPLGADWIEAGAKVGDQLGLPLGRQVLPATSESDGIMMGLRGAVLVRPDGHVAWRMPWLADDPATELGQALTSLTFRAA
jgi:2-polyprenyl-6-methoxyphenol hydroxylase-like FAD-dependent oxidoreductase